jgi:hypothetical protein
MELQVPEDFYRAHGAWDHERLQKEWGLWDSFTREAYVYWRELALDLSEDPILIANFAAAHALRWRRLRGCGTSEILFPDEYKQSGLFDSED